MIHTLLLAALLPAGGPFHSDTPLPVTPADGEIVFDGVPDEPAWNNARVLPLVMHQPTFGKEPTEHSEVRLTYDAEYLYLAGRLYESEPDRIADNSKKRDATATNTDWFGIVIDSYNDKENALGFFTNPNGLRRDLNVFNDANGRGIPFNLDWNTFWDVKTSRTSEGWFVEMRIPFTSLQMQQTDGEVVMGITVWRWIARKNEMDIFPAIPPDFGEWSAYKPSLAQEMTFQGVQRRRPFYVTPYALAGDRQSHDLNQDATAYLNHHDPTINIGGDIKIGLTDNLTLDLTVNTDFAQVEADDQQVNLTRASIFFPEKRLFFQERAGIFEVDFGSRDKLFYSRRIGIKDGVQVPILGGARLTGRSGKWDFGFMAMQTGKQDTFLSENNTVLRLRRQVFNDNSDAGVIFTSQVDAQGNYNATYGLDAMIRVWRQDFLSVRLAQTMQTDQANRFFSLDPTRVWISLSSQQFKGFNYGVSYSRSGAGFDPAMGFQARGDFDRQGVRMGYGWLNGEASPLQRHALTYRHQIYWSLTQQQLETYDGGLDWQAWTKTGITGQLSINYNVENIFEPLDFPGDVIIPVGSYRFAAVALEGVSPESLPFFVKTKLEGGSFYDGRKYTFLVEPTFTVSASLELGGAYEYNHLEFPARKVGADLKILRVKALYMLDTKFSISALVQYNSFDHALLGNFRLRYNPKEGNDLFIVYNDDINTERYVEQPFLPFSNVRSLQVKYTYTFRL